jgi:S-adenosylmethionine-dependent methyltransferase
MTINSTSKFGVAFRRFANWLARPKLPNYLSVNFRNLDVEQSEIVRKSLAMNYFAHEPEGYLSTEIGQQDLRDHLFVRLDVNRRYRVPWLDNAKSLRNSRILEIGCGTGCSTVALAEQGAQVTAVDVDDKALAVSKERCRLYGLDVVFGQVNATEIKKLFSKERFDFIIFWACLEHMTHEERRIAIKDTWDMLPSGSLLCVTDTPNRLWFYDSHTSQLPFFLWLPDELAFEYSRFSPRQRYADSFNNDDFRTTKVGVEFQRWGRGVSFHEFDLAINSSVKRNVVSSLPIFYRRRALVPFLRWRFSSNYKYESFLRSTYREIHPGFFQPYLDILIQKC